MEGQAGTLTVGGAEAEGEVIWFLWSPTWPGPGWCYVGKREGFGWVNYLWRRDDLAR